MGGVKLVFLVTTIILIILLLLVLVHNQENFATLESDDSSFANKDLTIFTFNPLLHGYTESLSINPAKWDDIVTSVQKNSMLPWGLSTLNSNIAIIVDPLEYNVIAPITIKSETLLQGVFLMAMSYQSAIVYDCGFDIYNKKVGYLTDVEHSLLKTIITGYRVNNCTPVYIEPKKWGDISKLLDKNVIDMCLVYTVPGSKMNELISNQPMAYMKFNGIDMDRINLFYPQLKSVHEVYTCSSDINSNSNTGLTFGLSIPVKDTDSELIVMSQILAYIKVDGKYAPHIYQDYEGFEVQTYFNNYPNNVTNILPPVLAEPVPEVTTNDMSISPLNLAYGSNIISNGYHCYGDPIYTTKGACNSLYDIIGQRKKRFMIWDKTCEKDSECPFYSSNINRGGCLDNGFCEMPIGVQQLSYRYYDNTPFCYTCDSVKNPTCCDGNWAFAGDGGVLPLS